MSAKRKKPRELRPRNPQNPRKITTPQLRMLGKSMAEFGDLGGIVYNRKTDRLVGGHQRTTIIERDENAAIELTEELTAPDSKGTVAWGWIVSNGVRFSYREVMWDETRERAAMIAANKHGGMWDDEKLKELVMQLADVDPDLIGMSDDEITELLAQPSTKGNTDPDDEPPPPAKPVSVLGDVWVLGAHRIVCGDSTKKATVQKALDGSKPKLMVTDPPYGVNYNPTWRVAAGLAETVASGKVMNDDWRKAYALFPGDVAYVWHAGVYAPEVAAGLESCGFAIRSQIIWNKGQMVMGRGDYHWQHEPCWYAVRKTGKGHYGGDRTQTTVWDIPPLRVNLPLWRIGADAPLTFSATAVAVVAAEKHAVITWAPIEPWTPQSSVWDIPRPKKNETGHGTQKPVECMLRPILNNSVQGDDIYEPFNGSGTTLIACEMSGRRCHAIELSPTYVDVTVLRWEAFTGRKAVHEATGKSYDEIKAERE